MSLYARMDVDTWTLLSMLWAIRDGRSKCFLDFDVGRLTGYLNCLSNHDLISFDQRQRLNDLVLNAQQHACCVIADLETQGWAE